MAGRVMPRDAINQKTVFADDDQQTVYNKAQDRNDNAEMSDLKTYHQGDLPGLKVGTTQMNPRSFTSGRFDSEEKTSAALAALDWYTIAETEAITTHFMSLITIALTGAGTAGAISILAGGSSSSGAKTHENTTLEILGNPKFSAGTGGIIGVRFVKSDTDTAAGWKLQIKNDASITPVIQMVSNVANGIRAGLSSVTPTNTDNDKTPDGAVGTFLEAGEELLIGNSANVFSSDIVLRKTSDDAGIVTVLWSEMPKQATGVTITLPSTFLRFKDGTGASASITGAHTTSNLIIYGRKVQYSINEIGAFAALDSNIPAFAHTAGTGGKQTLT